MRFPQRSNGNRLRSRTTLRVELLEKRELFAVDLGLVSEGAAEIATVETGVAVYHPTIVAGDPNVTGLYADSPSQRITNLFPGVGSLFMTKGGPSGYICTGTLIATDYVLTAGHCLDTNNDGGVDFKPSNVTFRTTNNGLYVEQRTGAALYINPAFTGFDGFNVNDDISIIKLSSAITNAEVYPIASLSPGQKITMVGYGQSGDGVNGYTVQPSLAIKRIGYNNVNPGFGGQDDPLSPPADEVFYGDFDGPTGNGTDNLPTLGNNLETTLGGGDSGGPSFVNTVNSDGTYSYKIAGVNTFTIDKPNAPAPKFGSEFGGIIVASYQTWITSVLAGNGGGGGGGGGHGGGKPRTIQVSMQLNDAAPYIAPSLSTRANDESFVIEDQVQEFDSSSNDELAPVTSCKPTSSGSAEPHNMSVVYPDDSAEADAQVTRGHLVDELLEKWVI